MAGPSTLDKLKQQEEVLRLDLKKIEARIYDQETQYLGADFTQLGTVFKGYEQFLVSKDAQRRKGRPVDPKDRLFSLSSKGSPAQDELRGVVLEQGIDPNLPLVRVFTLDRLQRRLAEKQGRG